jgi:hypothetical protein
MLNRKSNTFKISVSISQSVAKSAPQLVTLNRVNGHEAKAERSPIGIVDVHLTSGRPFAQAMSDIPCSSGSPPDSWPGTFAKTSIHNLRCFEED